MKKTIINLLTFATFLHITTTPISAYCIDISSSNCPVGFPYQCGGKCCTESKDCDLGQFSQSADAFQREISTKTEIATIGGIINSLLPYLFTIAGLILFAMLIAGGFSMLTAATDPKKAETGKQRITAAVVGFIIIFTAYWLTQILEIILGISIL